MVNPPPENTVAKTGERIAKLLARAGIASRREVERMIAEGRVKIGEEVITTPATVLPSLRGVSVDGKPVRTAEPTRLFAFHKPAGLITAESDPAGRPTIYAALKNALPPGTPRMMPVGRLDFNTEGLLLLTNDGELKRAMELPSSVIPRTYRARTFGDISQNQLEELIEGITIDEMHYGKIDANLERSTGRNQWIEVTLTEGKNREVRRVLEHLGLEVSRLLRTSYGPFELLDLPRGAAIEIRQVDVERFRKGLKIPPSARSDAVTATLRPAPLSARPQTKARPQPEASPDTTWRPEAQVRQDAKARTEANSRSTSRGRPESRGRTDTRSRPEAKERPEAMGRREARGRPETTDRPEGRGRYEARDRPEANGRPEARGRSDARGRPDATARPEGKGRYEPRGRPETTGRPEGRGSYEARCRPEANGRTEGRGRPDTRGRPVASDRPVGRGRPQPKGRPDHPTRPGPRK